MTEARRTTLKRWLLGAAELALVLAILALLALTWLPALIGPHARHDL